MRILSDYLWNSIDHLDWRNYGLEFERPVQIDYLISPLMTIFIPEEGLIELIISGDEYDERIPLLAEGNKVIPNEMIRKEKNRVILKTDAKCNLEKSRRLFYGINEVKWKSFNPPNVAGLKEIFDGSGKSIAIRLVKKHPDGSSLALDCAELPDRIFSNGFELFFRPKVERSSKESVKKLSDELGPIEFAQLRNRDGRMMVRLAREIKGNLVDESNRYCHYEMAPRDPNEGYWLTMREPKVQQQDDITSDSNKIEIFFTMLGEEDESEVVEVVDVGGKSINSKIRVFGIDREERRIKVERLPSDATTLIYPRDNSSQLRKQLDAVKVLSEYPSDDHLPLLKLFERRESVIWPAMTDIRDDIDWAFLTDEARDGNEEQRDFVRAGLSTPDLILLEGPPGSGKTTAISELVYQILTAEENKGKKVLLCAPTHVAVDNVISKMLEKFGSARALMENGVVPLRLGREEGRVDEDLRSFHIRRRMDEMRELLNKEEWFRSLPSRAPNGGGGARVFRTSDLLDQEKVLEDMVVNSSNLICGTTIGILNLPIFEERRKGFRHAFFDFMIIDEASKTTLTEFLVPAVKSKRWIIVGDVRQLAPSVDILGLRVNIDCKLEDKTKQRALLLFLKLFFNQEAIYRDHRRHLPPRFIYPASENEIKALIEEFQVKLDENARRREERIREGKGNNLVPLDYFRKNVLVISDSSFKSIGEHIAVITPHELGERFSEALNAYLIVVDRRFYEGVKDALPSTHIVIDMENPNGKVESSDFAFRSWSTFLNKEGRPITYHKEKGGDTGDYCEILDDLRLSLAKTWGSEVAWRLKRVYELNSSRGLTDALEDSPGKYFASIRALMPVQKRVYHQILNNARVSLPSVITSLQEGVSWSYSQGEAMTAISHGLPKNALRGRFHVLTFQHRMHPEISRVAREIFYQADDGKQRLKDSKAVQAPPFGKGEREWPSGNQPPYDSRFTWVDVSAGIDNRNVNFHEVDEIKDQLDRIIDYIRTDRHQSKKAKSWTIMIISFYEAQRRAIRDRLRRYSGMSTSESRFEKDGVKIFNYTVDMVQGREADFVLMSLSRTSRIGFMDCPNRINVAITRARYQLVIVGKADFFLGRSSCPEWRAIAGRGMESR